MFSYYAYGLGIKSPFPIPEFISAEMEDDVTINLDWDSKVEDYIPQELFDQPWALQLDRQKAFIYIKDTGVFNIQNGDTIKFVPIPGVSEEQIRFYLVGTVMGILLYQRGFLVLHASAVSINDRAVLFLGKSGDGKSSSAAAFYAQGYHLINDDVVPVSLGNHQATIDPGFPQIKLTPPTASALQCDFQASTELHPSEAKRGYRLKQEFAAKPLTIKRIYVLEYGTEFSIEPLRASEAAIELSRHSRPTTLFHSPDATHFFQCASLAKEQTIYRLRRPRNLELLPELVKVVEKHLLDRWSFF